MTEHWNIQNPEITPLRFLERFSEAVGAPVFLKHDDYGPLSWAGSKSRKLREILTHAVADGYDTVVMSGPAQSNSCRALAALARPFGLDTVLMMHGDPPDEFRGNLKITRAMEARLIWAGDVTYPRLAELADEEVMRLKAAGRRALTIEPGASSPIGIRAIVAAGQELADQMKVYPQVPLEVVHASASGGMHVGLWIASRLFGGAAPHSVMIVREIYEDVPAEYRRLMAATLGLMKLDELLGSYRPTLDWSAVGGGYGEPTAEAVEAAALLAKTEGILVDTIYTGKALGVLMRRARQGRRDPVVFWHSGGLPGFF